MKISTMLSYAGGFRESRPRWPSSRRRASTWCGSPRPTPRRPEPHGLSRRPHRDGRDRSAILPIYTRTPTLLAMTAAGIDGALPRAGPSRLGASAPRSSRLARVPYTAPRRTREIVESAGRSGHARRAHPRWLRSSRSPPSRPGTGLGKALKIIAGRCAARSRSELASLGEKNVALHREIANGWIPCSSFREGEERVGRCPSTRDGQARPGARSPPDHAAAPRHRGRDDVKAVRDLSGRTSRSTSAAWGQGRTSTTTWRAAAASKRLAAPSRTLLERQEEGGRGGRPDELLDLTTCAAPSPTSRRIAAFARRGHPSPGHPGATGGQRPST